MAQGVSSRRLVAVVTAVLTWIAMVPSAGLADHTPPPSGVAIAGSLQSELGCPGDWDPACPNTELLYDAGDGVWQQTFTVPAGSWEYKAALNDTWDENYGAGGVAGGPNIALVLLDPTDVTFYYSHESHWITDNVTSRIVTAPGSFQSELGCPGDWQPDCLQSWLQDPDGDGTYTFTTTALPAGTYEGKAAINESWDENYGEGGVAGGANIAFTVPFDGAATSFSFVSAANLLTITVDSGTEPLIADPVRQAGIDDVIYFVMTDRFANGDPGNDQGGSTSVDREVHGFDPTDKGFYHGGDLTGLASKLDYLQNLGITALWITPPFENRWVQAAGSSDVSAAYHGYWQVDLTTVDPHLGSNVEMQALIDAAHARGMKVYFDVVINHTGDVIQYVGGGSSYQSKDDAPYRDASGTVFDDRDFAGAGTFPPLDPAVSFPYEPTFATTADATVKAPAFLNDLTLYHNRGNSTFSGESAQYGDFFGLDDLFTEHPTVVEGMIDAHKAMISTFGIDGFRVDTVKHVNDEFWEAFVPAIRDHAAAEGNADFVIFGEVFDGDPAFLSRYTTELGFPAVLDFRFDGAAKTAVAYNGATDGLRDLFIGDDWFTDADSNAYGLVKFVGNHDLGRVGRDIDNGNPGVSDAERLARAELVQALNFLTRGIPVVYYGDEQGFTGDGGDKDARQDMFPSQVASYNDDNLIGTSATTGDDNFDTSHPLYQTIADLAALRDAHPTLRTGAQLHRFSEAAAGIYAFSRLDRTEQVEYVVAVNTSESADSATFATDSPSTTFTEIYPGTGPAVGSDADGNLTVDVSALGFAVYRAETAVPTDTAADGIAIGAPADGATVTGRTEIRATVTPGTYAEVTFSVSVDGGPFAVIGTDDNAPYAAVYDVSGLAVGSALTFKASVVDLGGNQNATQVSATVGAIQPPGGPEYAIVHYLRTDGDYGDHTTGDFNDFWGLHLWGDAIDPSEVTDWPNPKPFLGEDDYGRFAWIKLADPTQPVNFIVHRGDTKDGTDADRFFDPGTNPEIWLKQDDATAYTNQAAAQGFVTIHYSRPDGDYGDPTSTDYNDYWGLHLWGDAIAPGVGTDWTSPRPFDGVDGYGAYWRIPIQDATLPVNFIIHRGDAKDVDPDQSFIPAEQASVWRNQGDETLYPRRASAENTAVIHYHRPDGDYGDYTSTDFNDFWGMHVWTGALSPNPSWQEPVKPIGFDVFGPVFAVPLVDGANQLAYILHRGDTKDPGPDQFLEIDAYGYEVWQLSGADPEAPYILPILSGGVISRNNLGKQQAHWVDPDIIVWPAAENTAADYQLCWSTAASIEASDAGVDGADGCVDLERTGSYAGTEEGFFHLAGQPVLTVPETAPVEVILDSQAVVVASAGGLRVDATGIQIPGALDDLYAYDGELGVTWDGGVPTISVWAPTAQDVNLLVFANSDPTTGSISLEMGETNGVWSITGAPSWEGMFYLFEVTVYAPTVGEVVVNQVTDPYSVSLSTNSARSQIVDLDDADLAPDGWSDVAKPELVNPEDISIYEMHIRDFSVNDPSVPDEMKGTYKAFTLDNTYGMNHLEALTEAGLSHLHLLPAFDIATIDEDKSTWQSPSFGDLRALAPDADEQQAAVTATENLDGFNWGYDPWHYTTPEGSYSTNPDGVARIVEFREMVQSINETGLRVVMDVVYNHTNASGQAEKSVLDRIVPGYYHRLNADGAVEQSTCCENTATEHAMMGKLMIDSVVTWATAYKVDAFRFDLMGHHSKQNMMDLRAALDALTVENDGVDGTEIYFYGEGWNFGEVANDARFVQATQANMAGTGIGTFSDRLRDAVRGGSPFDGGEALVRSQGVINGLSYDPNELNSGSAAEFEELMLSLDQIRVGLAGNLAGYTFVDRNGNLVTGAEVDYNGQPAGYTADPQEQIVYVSKHDNQTLFDISQYRHPRETSMADRVRAQNLGMDFTLLAQGVPFLHAGVDTLRSKSLDRDSYNSGDWFNRLDWTYQENGWGSGLPVASKNQDNWSIMQPLLHDLPAPSTDDIQAATAHLQEALAIRAGSPLFRLETADDVQARLAFHNTGPDQIPALIVMSLDDTGDVDLDPALERIVVLFNAGDEPISYTLPDTAGHEYELHPVQQASSDPVVASSVFDQETGTFSVPARTTAVFVTDITPPAVSAELAPLRGGDQVGWYLVGATCTDADPVTTMTIDINGYEVQPGDIVRLITHPNRTDMEIKSNRIDIYGPVFTMTVTCSDSSGNTTVVVVTPGASGTSIE